MRGLVLLAALLNACGFTPERIFSDYTNIEVREVGRSLQCQSGPDSAAVLLADAAAVRDWQVRRGLNLLAPEALGDAPHALVELGQRPTGGYGIAVSRAAVLRGDLLILSATFISPGPGRMVTQALTSPCVLVRLPPGRYRKIEVQDESGAVRATGATAALGEQP